MVRASLILVLASLLSDPCDSASMSLQYRLEDRATLDRKHLVSKRDQMTLNEAIATLSDKPEVMALIQEHLIHTQRGNNDHSHHHLRRHHQTPAAGATATTAADRAKAFLNKMIEEAQDKLDLERVRCAAFEKKYRQLMEESTQAIASYNAQSAKARASIMIAETQIDIISKRIPVIQTSLETSVRECMQQTLAFRHQMTIISDDLEIMGRLVNATSCATPAGASLLQCDDDDAGESFIGFGHRVVRRDVMQLKSESLRQGVRELLWEADMGKKLPSKHRVRDEEMASFVRIPSFLEESEATQTQDDDDDDGDGNNMTPAQIAKMRAKCSMNKNPQCQKMNDKFILMQAEVMDKKQELEDTIFLHNTNCHNTQENYQSQLTNLEARLKDQQAALAEATEEQNNADEQSRLETIEYEKFDLEFRKGMRECSVNIGGFENEECSLSKLRLEIFNVDGGGTPPFIADCEVSSWVAEDCDKDCGGGKQRLTRTVTTQPQGGAACPVLEMEQVCNEQDCPINCELGQWSGWSVCSAACGGGVMERSRRVNQQPQHGGDQCGATTEAQPCNQQACNEDCKLGDWLGWSDCTQACGGGVLQRQRPIAVAAVGSGFCPDDDDARRIEYEECNKQPCIKPTDAPTFRCKAKLDVMLLLDGSGSLGRKGWDATVKAGSMFAQAMTGGDADINLAVLLFSGPGTRRALNRCMGTGRGVDIEKECNVKWVQRLSKDTKGAATKIKGLSWPARTTLTSKALSLAQAELNYGRRDAQSIVIVITDGRPMSKRAVFYAARKLRRSARLMFVPVTRYAPIRDMRRWASRPWKDNIIAVDDFATLQKPDTISNIIVDMCPKVY